jgi:hypothetical protein
VDNTINNLVNPDYDFYTAYAPLDPRLPNGGGYAITGLSSQKPGATIGSLNAVTLTTNQVQVWRGVDTNFVLRARGGLRLSGGTSTGSQYTDNCEIQVNGPNVVQQRGQDPACLIQRPFQTNVRANASYTIPWVDVLAGVVFQYRPGVEMNATYTAFSSQVTWEANPYRATNSTGCVLGAASAGCFTQGASATQTTVNLLANGEKYGEGLRLVDLKFAKNIRFSGKRLNIGFDVYNVFNADAALGYCATFPNPERDIQGCGSAAAGTLRAWRTVDSITTPRYGRFQVNFDF